MYPLYFILILVGYATCGTLTASLWQRYTHPNLPSDDLYAIKILWWVFAPIGLALLLMYALDYLFKDFLPQSRNPNRRP